MLSNTIDGSDGTDHFNGSIPKQVIEICQQQIHYLPGLRRGFETGLDSITQRLKKLGP